MNYQKIYYSIIEKRKIDIPSGYTEIHHIVPRCLGGGDDKINLVELTAKEHFICHLLLTKMYSKESLEYYKMCHAFLMMLKGSNNQQRYITSRRYEKLKVSFSERMSQLQSGANNNNYGTMWIHNKELRKSKKVLKDSILEYGWEVGRVCNWNKLYTKKFCKLCPNESSSKLSKYCDACRKIVLTEWATQQTPLQKERGTYVPPYKRK